MAKTQNIFVSVFFSFSLLILAGCGGGGGGGNDQDFTQGPSSLISDNVESNNSNAFSNDTQWTKAAGGNSFSIALRSDGTVWVTGDNSRSQLGILGIRESLVFQQLDAFGDVKIVDIAAAHYSSFAVDENGQV